MFKSFNKSTYCPCTEAEAWCGEFILDKEIGLMGFVCGEEEKLFVVTARGDWPALGIGWPVA